MAKRFTDSRKFNDPWYRKLPPAYKVLWEYIISTCDHAGMWKVDFEMAAFCVGVLVVDKIALDYFGDRVRVLSKDKWFIPKFIAFQYGELNPENRVHQSIIYILQSEGALKGLKRPLQGRKDKDKDKDKDKEKNIHGEFVRLTKKEYEALVKKFGEDDTKNKIRKMNNYIGSKGRKYLSHYRTMLVWADKDEPQQSGPKKHVKEYS